MKNSINPVPVAIIGPGRQGKLFARLADELAFTRLIAISGQKDETTHGLAATYGVPGYPQARYAEMLTNHPEIEAVFITSSEWAHLDPVLTAFRAGKHVLCEKPMAISPADAEQMVQAAESAGRLLAVCHSLRFSPRYAIMRESVVRGDIGDLLHIHARRNATPLAAARVAGKFPLPYWIMSHDIDMALWTVGQPVVRVSAESRSGATTNDDYITTTLTFANGVVARIENLWGTPYSGGRPKNELFTAYGTAGAAEVLGYEHGVVLYRDGKAKYPDTVYSPHINGQTEGAFRSLVRNFAGAVRGLWAPLVTGRDGQAVIQVAHAIDQALRTKREVEVGA